MTDRLPLPNPFEKKTSVFPSKTPTAPTVPSAPQKINPPHSGTMAPPSLPKKPILPPLPNPGALPTPPKKETASAPVDEDDVIEELAEGEYDLVQPIDDEQEEYLSKIYAGSSTPVAQQILFALSGDPDWQIRNSVALNPEAPTALLDILANDKNDFVRQSVLENPNTSMETLKNFAFDEDDDVQIAFIKNPRVTVELLEPLYLTDDEFIAEALLESEKVPDHIKAELDARF